MSDSGKNSKKIDSRNLRVFAVYVNNCLTPQDRKDLARLLTESDGGKIDIDSHFVDHQIEHYERPKVSGDPSDSTKPNPPWRTHQPLRGIS